MGDRLRRLASCGAKPLPLGLQAVHPPSEVTIVSNVGDDAEFFGVHDSPDIDIVLYHLAGLVDEERGCGLRGPPTSRTLAHRPRVWPWASGLRERDVSRSGGRHRRQTTAARSHFPTVGIRDGGAL
jgi:LPPG:FO 2-phospho-L-lactate transferase